MLQSETKKYRQTEMQIKVILIAIILLMLPRVLASQESRDTIRIYKKNQIGLQLNPILNETLFQTGGLRYMYNIAALRYGNRITKNLTSGIEFSCSFPLHYNVSIINFFNYRVGIFARYTYPAYSRFQIFAEASPYYFHYWREITATYNPVPIRADKFGYYAAPGLSLYTKNKKISFDLFYKFSNLRFQNGKKSVFSYKVNINF
ncbi:MAG: hypothetical protein IPN68_00815 [Bacteroidetes bacterium]|nr:hypothetical protein [Bacteroidota bacterium]